VTEKIFMKKTSGTAPRMAQSWSAFLAMGIITGLMMLSASSYTQNLGKQSKPKANLNVKTVVRDYNGGKDVAGGFGASGGAKYGWAFAKGGATLVQDATKTQFDQYNVTMGGNFRKIGGGLYMDKDELMRQDPVEGASAACNTTANSSVTVKYEEDQFRKFKNIVVAPQIGSLKFCLVYNYRESAMPLKVGPQKILGKIELSSKLAEHVNFTEEVSYAQPTHTASSKSGTMGARFSVNYTIK